MLEATSIIAVPAAVSLFSNRGAGDVGFGAAGFRFRVMAELVEGRLDTDPADYGVPRRRTRAFLTFVRRASPAADLLRMDPGMHDRAASGRCAGGEVRAVTMLEDLVLSDVCERACRELVEEQHRASLLRSQSLEPRHRVLLIGPPGNGKTSVAEAIAEALAVSFFVVRYDAIIGSFLGETASRLRRVFDHARTTPCVLFFDEFDAERLSQSCRNTLSFRCRHRSRVSRRAPVASRKARPGCLRGANSNASVRDSIACGQCRPPTRAGFRCATIRPASRPNARSSSRSRDR